MQTYRVFVSLACALGMLFGVGLRGAQAQPFELDGNATSEGGLPGPDWDLINASGYDGSLTDAHTGLVVDLPEPHQAIFHGGGSKDYLDISQWGWRNGNPPDKDDLTNAYAAAVTDPGTGHFVIVFGMDRHDTSGDAQLGFWFFQDEVYPRGTGNQGDWEGQHQEGDILVLVNFTKGGDVPTIETFQWSGGTAVQLEAADNALCENGWIPSGSDHCGITNDALVTAPWAYVNKDVGASTVFPMGAFFEGAIDLTALGAEACFTSFQAESRSSQSITAVLKDFANSGFPVCSISATKICENPRLNGAQDHIVYDIRGMVSNDGFGSVYDITLSDNPAADGDFAEISCSDSIPTGEMYPLASLSDQACYLNTITVPLVQNGLSDTVTATARTLPAGGGTELTATATATCPNLSISPSLSVSKDCRAAVTVMDSRVVAVVNVWGKVCNTGDTNLTEVSVDDLALVTFPFDPLLSGVSLAAPADPGNPTVAEGACVEYTGSYIPSAALDAEGEPTSCPSDVVFKDTVEANGTDIFGRSVTPATDMADCKLCADEGCPSPPAAQSIQKRAPVRAEPAETLDTLEASRPTKAMPKQRRLLRTVRRVK